MKVLFTAYEAWPIFKVGGLGDIAGSLPKFLKKLGVDIRLVLPGYAFIQKEPFLPGSDVPVYYLENSNYFQTKEVVSDKAKSREHFAWFSRQILASLPEWNFWPDIIHLNDWHPALTAVILKNIFSQDKRYAKIATLLTIHNLAYQGVSDPSVLKLTGLDKHMCRVLNWDKENRDIDILMEGIIHADFVNTVSPTYAKEISTSEFGSGLNEVLEGKEGRLTGILNGIDRSVWNPQTDRDLVANYGISDWSKGKGENKAFLKKRLELSGDGPLLAMVTRLTEQKGLDLLLLQKDGKSVLEKIIDLGAQIIILGSGEEKYLRQLQLIAKKIQGQNKFRFINDFDENLAHLIYASSDLFLLPSRFEPCGLTQMFAMRYGCLPLARKTGGLADTVEDGATGFLFSDYSAEALLKRSKEALNIYFNNPRQWDEMVENALQKDFSLEKSTRKYLSLYKKILNLKGKETNGQ